MCPYSLDTPGGVQNHVKDLAWFREHAAGHDVLGSARRMLGTLDPDDQDVAVPQLD